MPKISQQRKDDLVAKETAKLEAIFDFLKPPNSTDASYNEWLTYKPRMLTTMIKAELEELHKSQQLTKQLCKEIETEHAPKKNYHLTLNFPKELEDVAIVGDRNRTLRKYCEKLSYINRFAFNNEFFAEKGFRHHCHCILYELPNDINPARIRRDFRNKFKIAENFVDCHQHFHIDVLEDYITGKKATLKKEEYMIKDDIFRNENNLLNYFFSS